jgi:exosortase
LSADLPRLILTLLPFAWLWWRVIDHLRVEWSLNTQYNYGWVVPLICVYFVWRRLRDTTTSNRVKESNHDPASIRPQDPNDLNHAWRFKVALLLFSLAVFAWMPTRLIQEANPDWRLVSWALALETIAVSLLGVYFIRYWSAGPSLSRSHGRCSLFDCPTVCSLCFPLCFFLIAVPWPTFLEEPLVQALSRANASATVELLNFADLPAIQHGNIVEVKDAALGIDDPCSGIRSLQATLMISLFFGELYRSSIPARLLLCLIAVPLSFIFNVVRTTILAAIAAGRGPEPVMAWHDPAGVAVLLTCFACLWGFASFLPRRGRVSSTSIEGRACCFTWETSGFSWRSLWLALFVWIVISEIGTESWYRLHEGKPRASAFWTIELPRRNPTFKEAPFSEKAKRLLRFTKGVSAYWNDAAGMRFQAIYLEWKRGRIAAPLARIHTPEICLTAAGREMAQPPEIRSVSVLGISLPVRSYVFTGPGGPLHVFYYLWEDRRCAPFVGTEDSGYASRFGAVLSGERNCGQRSIEIAVWGIADRAGAEAVLSRELAEMIKLENADL